MAQYKLTLADLLTLLATVGFGFFCFLSFNFITMGDIWSSIIYAILIALVPGILALVVKLLKSSSRNFRTRIIFERLVLLMFIIAAFFAFGFFSHYFTVLGNKDEIQDSVLKNIEQAEEMFAAYEDYAAARQEAYEDNLYTAATSKTKNPRAYNTFGFVEGPNITVQIENKLFSLNTQLIPSNYEGGNGIKSVAVSGLEQQKESVKSDWGFTFGIIEILKVVPENTKEWREVLMELSSFTMQGEEKEKFEYPLSFEQATEKLTTPGQSTIVGKIVAVGLYMIMLLSYFVTERSTKNPYSLFPFLYRKRKSDNGDGVDIPF